MKRCYIYFIKDIKEAIKSIEEYIERVKDKETFLRDKEIQKLIIYEIIIIGEAATKISISTKNNNPQIDWRIISDMRNFLIHEYYNISTNVIWETAIKDIPKLKESVYQIDTGEPLS